jgi:hypothetical protein
VSGDPKPKLMNRRAFVAQTLQSVSTLALMKYAVIGKIGSALADTTTPRDGPGRQWYIQLSEPAPSGWDLWYWLHVSNPAWTDPTDYANNAYNKNIANKRYPDVSTSPVFDGWTLGPGAALWTQSGYNALNQMVLFQGIRSGGAHGDINETQRGSTAPYAENISRIIADYLDGKEKTLLGHTGVPATVYTPNRLLTAPIMTPLASQADWKYLTTSASSGLPTTRSTIVDSLVQSLGGTGLLSNLQRPASKSVYTSVTGAYNSSVQLSLTNYAGSKAFMMLWKQYVVALYDTFFWLNNHPVLKTTIRQSLQSGSSRYYCEGADTSPNYFCQDVGAITGFIDRTINPNMSDAQFAADITINMILSGQWGDTLQSDIVMKAWRYALTEFLITNNLTKVVDVQVSGADSHGSAGMGLYSSAFVMGGVRQLVANLSAIQVPGAPSGTSFLDRTLIACHSDFIRTADFSNDGGYGTNHGPSITIPMFGHGATPGVVGALGLGSDCTLFSGSMKALPGYPLPVDTNGKPSGSGTIIEKGNVLPTIAGIFNATVPLNQKTQFDAVSAVVKKFKVMS